MIDMAFSKDRAGDRKAWLSKFSTRDLAQLDVLNGPKISYTDFVDKELVQYSWHDVERLAIDVSWKRKE